MVNNSVVKVPADIKVITFSPIFSFEVFASSREMIIHMTLETIVIMMIKLEDTTKTSLTAIK